MIPNEPSGCSRRRAENIEVPTRGSVYRSSSACRCDAGPFCNSQREKDRSGWTAVTKVRPIDRFGPPSMETTWCQWHLALRIFVGKSP